MATWTIERSIWVDAPQERVWRAVTESTQIMEWWGGDYWEISAVEVGATIRFGNAENVITATVAVADPPHAFAIQWPPHSQNHMTSMVTTYRLQAENGGTRVTVTEAGFEHLPEEVRQQRFDRTSAGYATVLQHLKRYLEQQ